MTRNKMEAGKAAPPMGSIHININPIPPMKYRPGTYRKAFGKGRVLIGVDEESSIANLKESQNTGGAYTHTHPLDAGSGGPGSGDAAAGNTQPASSLPPYITVYMFVRVSKSEWDIATDLNPYNVDLSDVDPSDPVKNIYYPRDPKQVSSNGNPFWQD